MADMGMERGGVLWIMACGGVYYRAGDGFRSPKGEELWSGSYVTTLFGGGDRDLHASQESNRHHRGKIYHLADGRARYVTDFHYDENGERPGLYASKSGLLLNWGKRFLAVFVNGKWQRRKAELDTAETKIVEVGKSVYLVHHEKMYCIAPDGELVERTLKAGDDSEQEDDDQDEPDGGEFDPFRGEEEAGNPFPLPGESNRYFWVDEVVRTVPWDRDRLRAMERQEWWAYDLASGKAAELSAVHRQLKGCRDLDVLADREGNVVFVEGGKYLFLRITREDRAVCEDGRRGMTVSLARYMQNPLSVLHASDGSIWFGLEGGSILRYRDGRLRRFDWRDDVSLGDCRQLLEGPDGAIYARASGVMVYRPDQPARPVPAWIGRWEEFELASSRPTRDSRGNVWMMLRERPGEISRWDGNGWQHFEVPFNTAQRRGTIADDQGHLLLYDADVCYDFSPAGVAARRGLREAVVAAVARGVKRFDYDGCAVLPRGKIWLAERMPIRLGYYDGKHWTTFSIPNRVESVIKSPTYGVLIRTNSGDFYTYDRGQMRLVGSYDLHGKPYAWGCKGLQPYERELFEARPQGFVLVESGRLFHYPASSHSDRQKVEYQGDPRAALSYVCMANLVRGFYGGHWTRYTTSPPYRFFGDRVVATCWNRTPVISRTYAIRETLEDRGHNLWVYVAGMVPRPVALCKRVDAFRLRARNYPSQVGRTARFAVEVDKRWRDEMPLRLFWRVDGGPWHGGELGTTAMVSFQNAGAHQVELLGMGPQGETTPRPVKLQVHVRDTVFGRR